MTFKQIAILTKSLLFGAVCEGCGTKLLRGSPMYISAGGLMCVLCKFDDDMQDTPMLFTTLSDE